MALRQLSKHMFAESIPDIFKAFKSTGMPYEGEECLVLERTEGKYYSAKIKRGGRLL
jgi:hypothetical protein